MSVLLSSEIELGQCCDLLEQSEVKQSIDLGSSVIHDVIHAEHGRVILINTACGRAAAVKV